MIVSQPRPFSITGSEHRLRSQVATTGRDPQVTIAGHEHRPGLCSDLCQLPRIRSIMDL